MTGAFHDPIAIDGPAASGKTTLGLAIARECGYRFLDTGLMYRAYALAALEAGIAADDERANARFANGLSLELAMDREGNARIAIDGVDVTGRLREPQVEASVSGFSAVPAVRTRMVALQREFAAQGRSVLAGRDIGTVVLPDAPLKFFVTASEEARAERRSRQAGDWGQAQSAEGARRDVSSRDRVDSGRAISPLMPAGDAIVIDTTSMTLEEVIAFALERVHCADSSQS